MPDTSFPVHLDGSPRPDESAFGLLPAELRAWMRVVASIGSIEQQFQAQVKTALGVSHDEFLVLCLLAEQPGTSLRMTQIARELGRPKTRLTHQVACLYRAGLITRSGSLTDRRGIEVALTDKARRLLRDGSAPLAEALAEAVTRTLSPDQREMLRGLLPGHGPAPSA